MFKNASFRTKITGILLAVGILPILGTMGISYFSVEDEILKQASQRAESISLTKVHAVEAYFETQISSLTDLSNSSVVKTSIKQFKEAMDAYGLSAPTPEEQDLVKDFYRQTFAPKFKSESGEEFNLGSVSKNLDTVAVHAQYDYIANNSNALGEKNNLIKADRAAPYNDIHAIYHEEFQDYLNHHNLYDLFLLDRSGRIIYSVFKETDFAQNVATGDLRDSGIGKAFVQASQASTGNVHIEDFAPYLPSYNSPASFISMPIYERSNFLGVIIIQLPIDEISSVANDRSGLGKQGQVIMVGNDGRLRANAFRDPDGLFTIAKSFSSEPRPEFEGTYFEKAFNGTSSVVRERSYDDLPVLAALRPVAIENLSWVIKTELAEDEIFEGLNYLTWMFIGIIVVGSILIGIIAIFFGRSVSRNLNTIISALADTTKQITTSSSQSERTASSISSAATQQASSLQETMASAEEISAMISQNADSAKRAQETVKANGEAAKGGSAAATEMVGAIGEIKETNEKILKQMEASNKEFSEIVDIIGDIGEKTKVINDIVFQTKLLSFNASVEAARAGEHGNGFAVVAEEVGNLARMSGSAAEEITGMLTASIKRVNAIVSNTKTNVEQLVEIGRDKVAMGQSTADQCRVSLENLSENAVSLTTMVTEIAHASSEQAQGISEINSAIQELDSSTQTNSSAAQCGFTQSEALLRETKNLDTAVQDLILFVAGKSTAKGAKATKATKATELSDKSSSARNVVPISGSTKQVTHTQKPNDRTSTGQGPTVDGVPMQSAAGFEDF